MEGQHFADYQTFQISIGATPSFPVMTWVLAFLLIVFVVMGALYARREKQEESGEKQK
jgi:preprotein translocase subunit SecG